MRLDFLFENFLRSPGCIEDLVSIEGYKFMTLRLRNFFRAWALAFMKPLPFLGILYLPRYFLDLIRFNNLSKNNKIRIFDSYPCLFDATEKTAIDAHYFYQAAWLARELSKDRPENHVDVGSSLVTLGVVSGFIPVSFIDIRPPTVELDNFKNLVGDICQLPIASDSIKSLSSLHVIEHIGLGRYGDKLDPLGAEKAALELERVLSIGGRLYLSTPIGRERICFNAHRVFNPSTVIKLFNNLTLLDFKMVDDRGCLHMSPRIEDAVNFEYGCGLFVFSKDE